MVCLAVMGCSRGAETVAAACRRHCNACGVSSDCMTYCEGVEAEATARGCAQAYRDYYECVNNATTGVCREREAACEASRPDVVCGGALDAGPDMDVSTRDGGGGDDGGDGGGDVPSGRAALYEACGPGITCEAGTECVSYGDRAWCTVRCSSGSDPCPRGRCARSPSIPCAAPDSDGSCWACFELCDSVADCPAGFRACMTGSAEPTVCVP